jgi:hypothetical protein
MVQSEQRGHTRRLGAHGRSGKGMEKRNGVWALTVAALLVVVVIFSVTACGSSTQAGSNTTVAGATATTASGQASTGQSMPSGAPSGTPPSGAPTGAPPSGGTSSSTDTAGSTTTTVVSTDSTTTTEAATTTTSLADNQHGDGIYKAGTDISTGLYKGTVVATSGHWEISSDANGDKYVSSGDPTGQFYVKVTWGQYLHLTGVIIQKASSTAADPLATTDLKDGTYRVGYDIKAGWYNGTLTDGMGYWQVSKDANGQTLVANDYPLGSFTLKVKTGQYLTLRGVTVSLQQ